MNAKPSAQRQDLWVYMVLPSVILNLGGCLIFGTYYGLASQQPESVAGFDPAELGFGLYVLIFVVEWALAISLIRRLRRTGASVMDLIAPQGDLWRFRCVPAVIVFVLFNAVLAAYMARLWVSGTLQVYESLNTWQYIFMIGLKPITAGFCEELIWRGYIITRLEARGRSRRLAVLLSAVSFALIHGLFFPVKLLVTFLIGIVTGLYYTRERNLVPLMVTHLIADVWSFGLLLFV